MFAVPFGFLAARLGVAAAPVVPVGPLNTSLMSTYVIRKFVPLLEKELIFSDFKRFD